MRVFLETERLLLRQFTGADVDHLFALYDDPEVMRYLNGGEPADRAEIEEHDLPAFLGYYERFPGYGFWAAIEKSSGDFLGWFHFRPLRDHHTDDPELGYRLNRSSWGKGYATEGSLALLKKGFTEFGARRIWAATMAVNLGSRRVMEKIGMRHVRTYHEHFDNPIPGTEEGEVEYAITLEEWRTRVGLVSGKDG
ncbi:Protein N-acetyltransferase, RimJ/RimL family [Amycolatopsis lurida]|uniref:GNAT family acetyltransferase n=1 Tax=Amycolatopsis lurida NRRL 2430 TaxID=1460371 RepID=A0A2P2FSL0_AMYLU|nr:GNAT family N-acetyltransferase [Amycolatopsis lurida]KFU79689.1 GNAT family acetyltransferase [Amycolatopsis lurida NRRL 2430]SED02581.1 Protein N-acetyltransferase, RimJ/RimL family [Amycolatopsis lurida]